MNDKLLRPQVDVGVLVLRLALAAVFIVHGYIKVIQDYPLFPEMSMTMQQVIGWAELIGGVALAIGFLSRLAALGIIVIQVGAIIKVTGAIALEGMTMDRHGANFTRVGPEFNLTLIAMCLAVFLMGSGSLSVDYCLQQWWRNRHARAREAPAAAPGMGRAVPA